MNPILYLPIAPPAAGKSHTAQVMLDNNILKWDDIVEPDHYRAILTGSRKNQIVNSEVFKLVDMIVETRLREGCDVYLDATNLNTKFRNNMVGKLIRDIPDVRIIILTSDASKELLDIRNERRLHTVPQHVLDRMWEQSFDLDQQINFPHEIYLLIEAQQWKERP